jgi:hypothetical protein
MSLRCDRNYSVIVTRSVAFAGAVALVLVQPIAAFAAPPAVHPVYRPAPSPASGERWSQGSLKAPFNFNLHPQTQEFNPQADFNPLRWRRWQWESLPPFLPYQSGCYATGMVSAPWSLTAPAGVSAPPSDFTIGSLVDDRSKELLSSPSSYAQDLAASNTGGPETSGPLTFQYGFQSVPCGASDFFNI